jgi:hypothetical protein
MIPRCMAERLVELTLRLGAADRGRCIVVEEAGESAVFVTVFVVFVVFVVGCCRGRP